MNESVSSKGGELSGRTGQKKKGGRVFEAPCERRTYNLCWGKTLKKREIGLWVGGGEKNRGKGVFTPLKLKEQDSSSSLKYRYKGKSQTKRDSPYIPCPRLL